MVKINQRLLPVKAHYFFFMAAMGPILPQLSVYGKDLGVTPEVMGRITAILPIMYVIAKPIFGFIADFFSNFRKCIFLLLIITMTISYAGFYFIPEPNKHLINLNDRWDIAVNVSELKECETEILEIDCLCSISRFAHCVNESTSIDGYFVAGNNEFNSRDNFNNGTMSMCLSSSSSMVTTEITSRQQQTEMFYGTCSVSKENFPDCVYGTTSFWYFVILLCIGTISFNVTNSLSDAICFDVLGDQHATMKYGAQRVWATIGFGISAFVAGIAVDTMNSFAPAIIVMLIFSCLDLISVTKVKIPNFSSDESIFKEILGLLKRKEISIFLAFATAAGIIDSFIIYFMFWHLEEVAKATGHLHHIKLIEGCVVAAECLMGEIPIFFYSGKIIKKLGYVHCLSFCFFAYAVRLALIAWIPNPWYLIPVEMFMQGLTYALCYTVIVAYAAIVAPVGTSATVQGLVAGMDDGLGFAIGSLIGGWTLSKFGGRQSFYMFSCGALITCIAHVLIRPGAKHKQYLPKTEYHSPVEQVAVEKEAENQ